MLGVGPAGPPSFQPRGPRAVVTVWATERGQEPTVGASPGDTSHSSSTRVTGANGASEI